MILLHYHHNISEHKKYKMNNIIKHIIIASGIVLLVHILLHNDFTTHFLIQFPKYSWLLPYIGSSFMIIATVVLIYFSKHSLFYYGVRMPESFSIGTLFLVSTGVAALLSFVSIIFSLTGYSDSFNTILPFFTITQMILFIVIYGPIAEELFFRGFIQHYLSLLKTTGISFFGIYLSLATLITSILFTVAHWPLVHLVNVYGVAMIFTTSFVCGIITGHYVESTGSLLPPLIVHMIFNIIAILEFFILKTLTA